MRLSNLNSYPIRPTFQGKAGVSNSIRSHRSDYLQASSQPVHFGGIRPPSAGAFLGAAIVTLFSGIGVIISNPHEYKNSGVSVLAEVKQTGCLSSCSEVLADLLETLKDTSAELADDQLLKEVELQLSEVLDEKKSQELLREARGISEREELRAFATKLFDAFIVPNPSISQQDKERFKTALQDFLTKWKEEEAAGVNLPVLALIILGVALAVPGIFFQTQIDNIRYRARPYR